VKPDYVLQTTKEDGLGRGGGSNLTGDRGKTWFVRPHQLEIAKSVKLVVVISFLIAIAIAVRAEAQTPPMVIAWQAPTDETTLCPPVSGSPTCFDNFVQYELPYISGIGVTVTWESIDNCSSS
jgi:hypothetical protein